MSLEKPVSANREYVAELSFRAIILAIILTALLAMSNAYLALKLGILTSASIPAAIISMGILRFFKRATILENNAVQTAASAGEAVAGGIVYTIPALIIIQYWHQFSYWTNFLIAFIGGVLGVLFSIPLRRLLVNDAMLKFPEGVAIAEVLKSSANKGGIRDIFIGGLVGAGLELCQMAFKVIASSWSYFFTVKRAVFGVGLGFSATMVGAGYLVGHEMAISIILGALIAWGIVLPLVSLYFPEIVLTHPAETAVNLIWSQEMRYLGIGAMLFAGIWTFLRLIKPLANSIYLSVQAFLAHKIHRHQLPRTDRDIPMPFILIGTFILALVLVVFFQYQFPLKSMGLTSHYSYFVITVMVLYVVIVGFLFSVITAYFSGMVGVTASPGSSIVIAGMLLVAWILLSLVNQVISQPWSPAQIKAAEAITIIIGSVVTGIAAIANDNTQDLKVGQLVGATPWKQQVMLLIGVLVSSLVIPPVMQLLFNVYGIAGVMPHSGMDISQSLPAPTAALMAAITEAVFRDTLPWTMLFIGAGIIVLMIIINRLLHRTHFFNLSILGVAIGMYLPLSSSVPLFFGGAMAWSVRKYRQEHPRKGDSLKQHKQVGVLIACGLVAGSALMDVMLAIPFSLMQTPDALSLVGARWQGMSVFLGLLSTGLLALWIKKRVTSQ